MAVASTAPAFLAALKTALAQRLAVNPVLANVRVDLVPTADTSVLDSVTLVRGVIRGGQEPITMVKRRLDSYEIPGVIHTVETGPDSDLAFQQSLNRAALILDEIVLEVLHNPLIQADRPTPTLVTDISYEPQIRESGGWVTRCEYTIEYAAVVA